MIEVYLLSKFYKIRNQDKINTYILLSIEDIEMDQNNIPIIFKII